MLRTITKAVPDISRKHIKIANDLRVSERVSYVYHNVKASITAGIKFPRA